MKTSLFLFSIFFLPRLLMAQGFIEDSPDKVKKKLQQYQAENAFHSVILETDSSISLVIEDSSVKSSRFIFLFRNKKCIEEVKISCDTCVVNFLTGILKEESMQWRKINSNTWLSRYNKHLQMDVEVINNQYYLRIRKTHMDKKAYEKLIASTE